MDNQHLSDITKSKKLQYLIWWSLSLNKPSWIHFYNQILPCVGLFFFFSFFFGNTAAEPTDKHLAPTKPSWVAEVQSTAFHQLADQWVWTQNLFLGPRLSDRLYHWAITPWVYITLLGVTSSECSFVFKFLK
jgi:hypothetical protein